MNDLDGDDLIWETQSWDFLNPADTSGRDGGGSDDKSGMNLPDSSTQKSQTPSGNEAAAAEAEVEVVAAPGKKRSSDKGGKKNGKGIAKGEKSGGNSESSDHEVHIWTERERRKKMRTMFSNLHALLPHLPPKADKSTIVDEAVNHIKTLQNTLQKLQKQKLEKLHGVQIINYDLSSLITTSPKLAIETREAFVADQVSSNINNIATNNNNSNMLINSTNSSNHSSPHFPPVFQSWSSKNLILNVSGLDAQICICSTKKAGLLTAICFVLEKYKLEVVSAQVSSDICKNMYMVHTHACCLDLLDVIPVEEIYKQAVREIIFFINSE